MTYHKLLVSALKYEDIGKPLLYRNKGEEEFGILTAIHYKRNMVEVYFAGRIRSLLLNPTNLFTIKV